MNKKPTPKVTSDDVHRALNDAATFRDQMTDMIVLIAADHCDDIADPRGCARRCLEFSRLFANACAIFLAREDLQGTTR